jgi:hypothetical protein
MKNQMLVRFRLYLLVLFLTLVGCDRADAPSNPYDVEATLPSPPDDYLSEVNFDPTQAEFFDHVNSQFNLTEEEIAMLAQNGFVVTDRLAFADFTTAYAYLHWKDMPVLITTDAMLQALHETYDDMLQNVEEHIMQAKVDGFLLSLRHQIMTVRESNENPELESLYEDVYVYLTIPLVLLGRLETTHPEVEQYLELVNNAAAIETVSLFGTPRDIDFTLFQPRGHYNESEELANYFRAMSWLAHIDFRLVEADPDGILHLNQSQLAAAILLHQAIKDADAEAQWQEIDDLLGLLVGASDNTTLEDLQRFLADANLTQASNVLNHPDPGQLLTLLSTGDYGQQRITGQLLYIKPNNPAPLPRPVSFMLLGQRFTVDSYVMSHLVYDRLTVNNEKVKRPFPNPLDVMVTLGNNQALPLLEDELDTYGYEGNLAALQVTLNNLDPSIWNSNVYHRWLGMLRALNMPTTGENYPQAIRTQAWSNKMLHTQLASWAQLRHDNILYAKQSVTGMPVCTYPVGYIEPYPDFYAAMRDYARVGQTTMNNLNSYALSEYAEEIRQISLNYFVHLEAVSTQLQTMAEKELRHEPFTLAEEEFIKTLAIRTLIPYDTVCAGILEIEEWGGWYVELFPWEDDNPALIADVHTNPAVLLPPTGVLHVGTGPVATMLMVVDTPDGMALHVGPVFTYYEFMEPGLPLNRLTDEQWNNRLEREDYPLPPAWVNAFRLSATTPPTFLELPEPRE